MEPFCADVPARLKDEQFCADLSPAAFPSGSWAVTKNPFSPTLEIFTSHSQMPQLGTHQLLFLTSQSS